MKLSDCWTNQRGRRRSLLTYENFEREMKLTKKRTSKKDVTTTLVIRPRILLSKAKKQKKAWDSLDSGVDRSKSK